MLRLIICRKVFFIYNAHMGTILRDVPFTEIGEPNRPYTNSWPWSYFSKDHNPVHPYSTSNMENVPYNRVSTKFSTLDSKSPKNHGNWKEVVFMGTPSDRNKHSIFINLSNVLGFSKSRHEHVPRKVNIDKQISVLKCFWSDLKSTDL